MYAARAAGAALRALLHEDDFGRADSFQEKRAGPTHLSDQRVALDLQLVHVFLRSRMLVNDTQQNLIAIERICTCGRLRRVTMAVDCFIECHRKMAILAQIEANGEFPRLAKHRALPRIDVGAGHRRRNRLRVAWPLAARKQSHSHRSENRGTFHGFQYGFECPGFHFWAVSCSTSRMVNTPLFPTSQSAARNAPSANTRRSRAS